MRYRERGKCIILILGFLLNLSQCLRFDLLSGQTKCIFEDIRTNSMTVGKYDIVNPNEGIPLPETHKVTVRVTSPYGKKKRVRKVKQIVVLLRETRCIGLSPSDSKQYVRRSDPILSLRNNGATSLTKTVL